MIYSKAAILRNKGWWSPVEQCSHSRGIAPSWFCYECNANVNTAATLYLGGFMWLHNYLFMCRCIQKIRHTNFTEHQIKIWLGTVCDSTQKNCICRFNISDTHMHTHTHTPLPYTLCILNKGALISNRESTFRGEPPENETTQLIYHHVLRMFCACVCLDVDIIWSWS